MLTPRLILWRVRSPTPAVLNVRSGQNALRNSRSGRSRRCSSGLDFRALGGFASEVRRTRVDNVLAKVGGAGKRLLIMGHADEINFMV